MINIVLVDDNASIRKGLRALLDHEPDFSVVGEAGDGLHAIERIQDLKPDIAVLDFMMPGLNGLEVTREITQKCPQTRIVILSMHSNQAYVLEALRLGAKAYILKDQAAEELITAVREVSSGRTYLGSSLPEDVLLQNQIKNDVRVASRA